jgi:alginate export protein
MGIDESGRAGLLATLGLTLFAAAAVSAQDPVLHGQLRPRYEYKEPSGGGPDAFTSMRVRFGLDVAIEDGLSIFIQAQDVRIWGEESHPLFDFRADNFDLHQGYLKYRGEATSWLTTTVGRMETNFGGQRLVGAVDWTQQAQSFDGVRFDAESGRTSWALIGYTIRDETAAGVADDEKLYGVYGTLADVGPGALDLYWLYDRLRGGVTSDEHLIGARYVFSGDVNGRLEATLETGSRSNVDVSAFMLGARVGKSFSDGEFSATLWYDYLSGDDPTTPEVEVFNTFFATNHKFYGFADLFLNIPANTAGAGLQDMALKLSWKPTTIVNAGLDMHAFRAANQGTLTGTRFGEEIDVTVSHRQSAHLSTTVGLSYVIQGDLLAEIGRLDKNLTWFYVMLNATF